MNYILTDRTIDRCAKALAEAANGGLWDFDYAEEHKAPWRQRVIAAMARGAAERVIAARDI